MFRSSLFLLTAASLAATTLSPVRAGEDFRIDTDVFLDDQQEPVVESLTLFSGRIVYDFLLTGIKEITVFDPEKGRFVLLDVQRRVQTELTTEQVREVAMAIKDRVEQGGDDGVFNPDFQHELDQDDNWLSLSSEPLTYRAKGIEPKYPSAVRRYREFADGYAYLNALRPGNLPPFARIQLNRELSKRGWIPEEVERILVRSQRLTKRKQQVRSRHHANWRLSERDRKRIELVSQYMASFKTVEPSAYFQTSNEIARTARSR